VSSKYKKNQMFPIFVGKEFEKKFLLRRDGVFYTSDMFSDIIPDSELEQRIRQRGVHIQQGYFSLERGREIGIALGMPVDFPLGETRLRKKGNLYYFTAKDSSDQGREEFDPEINQEVFTQYWGETLKRVEKLRLELPWRGFTGEIDLYIDGRDLIVGEVETSQEKIHLIVPMGMDVTLDKAYKNKNLARPVIR
jgi:adenylate cyclase